MIKETIYLKSDLHTGECEWCGEKSNVNFLREGNLFTRSKEKLMMWLAKIFYDHIDPWFEKYRHTLTICYHTFGEGKIRKIELKFSSDEEMQAAVREIEDIIKKYESETINKTIEK